MKELYAHQMEALNELITSEGHPIFCAPTGGGKTLIAAHYIKSCIKKGEVVFFNVHRQELIRQSFLEFNNLGIDCGILSAKATINPYSMVQICSVMTLVSRLDAVIRKPSKLIFDEAHHCRASSWEKIIKFFPGCQRVGLTATPGRTDGKGLDCFFSHIIPVPDISWHIEHNYLANFIYYQAQRTVHIEDRKTQKSMDAEAEKRVIIGDVWEQYCLRNLKGRATIAFCSTINKSKELVAEFEKKGISSAHLDGSSNDDLRSSVITRFEKGEITLLSNVRLFTEGFNSPNAVGLLDLAPTSSVISKRQRDGRVLRLKDDGSKSIIIDFVENWRYAGGFPDTPISWTLAGSKKKNPDVKTKECPSCGGIYLFGPILCPYCNYRSPVGEAIAPEIVSGTTSVHYSWYDRMMTAHEKGLENFSIFWLKNNQRGSATEKFNELTERKKSLKSLNSYVSCLIFAGRNGYKKNWANIAWRKIKNGESLF